MPSRPGVAAIVRMEVDDAGPLASSLEAGLDLSAAIGLPLVRLAVRQSQRLRLAARFNTADMGVYICRSRVEFSAFGFKKSAARSIAAWSIFASGVIPKKSMSGLR